MTKFLSTLFLAMTFSMASQAQMLPYQNPKLSAEERAADLCTRLTLEEKVKIMMDRSPAIERLGIPEFHWWNEALHGAGRNGTATVFPITMCMASSWNDALLYKVFDAVSDELRAKNTLARHTNTLNRYRGVSVWTPNINIFRDPRWGRGQETYGEDPYLTSRMGVAVVKGLQGPAGSKYFKTFACAKHFAVHSGPEWNRHSFNVEDLPERDLWETYLPAFKALVKEGNVREVMCAYQSIDGQPCCGNNRYLQQILRDEWQYDGLVVSDCSAISDFWVKGRHGVSENAAQASAKAVLTGTDVECGSNYKSLPEAIKAGAITEAQIDVSIRRLLKARFELGDFDADELNPWTKIPESVVASKEHKEMALEMARQGIVLLENKNKALPLDADNGGRGLKLYVMGPNADNEMMQWGNYNGFPTETITLLEGIKSLCPDAQYIGGIGYTRNEMMVSRIPDIINNEGKQGLKGTYWNNASLQGTPVATATYDKSLHLNNGGATVFAPGVELNNFSARYEGTFKAKKTERLMMTCDADDGIRIIFNGDTICNIWKTREAVNHWNEEVYVEAGKDYPIIIEYMQTDNYAMINFDMASKTTASPEELVRKTADSDCIIFCGGISPQLEGEEMKVSEPGFKGGDRTSIELPKSQREIVKALCKAGRKVVFVNCSGSAVALAQEKNSCAAVVQAWYPGEQGGKALAEILFGKVCPSGKLPVTFYASDNDLPDFLDYTMKNRTYRYFTGTPSWAFGHGLSYTRFKIGKVKISKDRTVQLALSNKGDRDGTETVQVYIRRIADKDGAKKTLRAFQRVNLKAGETQQVSIQLAPEQFECWDAESNTMRLIPGKYDVMVGTSSDDPEMRHVTVTI